jgi:hypothetical protein
MRLLIALALLTVAACAPLETYYKPGASVEAVARATTTCQVDALRQVPSSTRVRQLPPRYVPGRQVCNAAGQCGVTRGYYVPGPVESYDPNDGLRRRVEGQCMADRGYAPVSIPPCPDAIARATPPGVTRTLPRLTERSCVIRNRNGTFQIVNRG